MSSNLPASVEEFIKTPYHAEAFSAFPSSMVPFLPDTCNEPALLKADFNSIK